MWKKKIFSTLGKLILSIKIIMDNSHLEWMLYFSCNKKTSGWIKENSYYTKTLKWLYSQDLVHFQWSIGFRKKVTHASCQLTCRLF